MVRVREFIIHQELQRSPARWLLDGEIFYTPREAQIVIKSWRRHYNTVRPHILGTSWRGRGAGWCSLSKSPWASFQSWLFQRHRPGFNTIPSWALPAPWPPVYRLQVVAQPHATHHRQRDHKPTLPQHAADLWGLRPGNASALRKPALRCLLTDPCPLDILRTARPASVMNSRRFKWSNRIRFCAPAGPLCTLGWQNRNLVLRPIRQLGIDGR